MSAGKRPTSFTSFSPRWMDAFWTFSFILSHPILYYCMFHLILSIATRSIIARRRLDLGEVRANKNACLVSLSRRRTCRTLCERDDKDTQDGTNRQRDLIKLRSHMSHLSVRLKPASFRRTSFACQRKNLIALSGLLPRISCSRAAPALQEHQYYSEIAAWKSSAADLPRRKRRGCFGAMQST